MTDMHIDGRTDSTGAVSNAASAAGEHAKDLTHHAGDEIGSVLDTTKEQTRGLVDEARSRAADEADTATRRAADALSGTAKDLTDLGSGHGSPDSPVAGLVRQAGERVDRAATQLQERGYQGVTEDVTRWARAHPAAFLGLAAGAGFVVARVFRAADTQGVMDAAKGSTSSTAGGTSSGEAPQLSSGDPSLFADERRMETPGEAPDSRPTSPADELSIDLTDPVRGGATPGGIA